MAARPNLVMVHCHDLGQYLHCYGIPTVQTPHLDRFAAEGVRFANSFCTAPSCSPSRASIFTGRYPHSNGVMGLCHANFAWDLHPGERHLAQILREAGYRAMLSGVIHETRSGAERCGYERHLKPPRAKEATDNALTLLDELRAGPDPFFLCVGYVEPHRLPQVFEGGLPGDHSFPGPHLQPDDALGVHVPGHLADTPATRRELAGLQGAVKHADEQFGRILAALDERGLRDSTLVIFTTDHGVAMPRAKCSLYEPGLQTSLLLRLPSRPGWHGGTVAQPLVLNTDYVPTICELLGLPIPAGVQGRSFVPLLEGGAYTPRTELCCEMTYHDYYDPRRSIRTATHKLIANFTTAPEFMDPSQSWRPPSDPASGNHAVSYHPHLELYDLQADPWELRNLAAEPAQAAVRDDLLRRLQRHLVETADPILDGAITPPHHREALAWLRGERRQTG